MYPALASPEPTARRADTEEEGTPSHSQSHSQSHSPNHTQSHTQSHSPNRSQKPVQSHVERAIPLLRSCERCRRRKQRCDGEQPVCGRCKSHHADCSYRQSGRFRKRFPRTDDKNDATGAKSSDSTAGKRARKHQNQHQYHSQQQHRYQRNQASSDDTLSAATTLSALSSILHTPPPPQPPPPPPPSSSSATLSSALSSSSAVPELSPCTVSELSPNDPLVNTPVSAMASAVAGDGGLLGMAKNMDPVAILKAYSLPDLAQGLPEHIVRRMWALISEGTATSSSELPPNMDLLDPRNTATNARNRYAVNDIPWLQGDPLANLDAASSQSPSPPPHSHPHLNLNPHSHPHSHAHQSQSQSQNPTEAAWLAQLQAVGRRHELRADPQPLLALLQTEHDDSGLQVGARQFWATLEAGTATDFEVLAHVAVAAASATGSASSAVANSVEIASYEAARREWERGLVRPSTGAVCALLQLSEYGYRTGRSAVHWEFAQIAEVTARRIEFRGHAYPWRTARIQMLSGKCDSEYEHVLAVFWTAWSHALAAAQVLARRLDPLPDPLESAMVPELPLHDMCRFAARFPPAPCRHSPAMSYAAAVWRCYVIAAPVHAALMDVRESRCALHHYFAAVDRWVSAMRAWRAAWPPQWEAQLARLMAVAPAPAPAAAAAASGAADCYVEDAWLVHMHLVHESFRLRVHATALALMHGPPAAPSAPGGAPMSRNILVARNVHPDARRQLWGFTGPTFDPLGEALIVHRGRYESLEAVRAIQRLLELVGAGRPVKLQSLGCWVVSVLDLAIALHCGRMAKEDVDSQIDSIRRLGILVSLLLQLRRWTAALYVFTSIVKAYVEPNHLIDVQNASHLHGSLRPGQVHNSPWPANHILTLLMRELDIPAPEFCGLTLPVVYASVLSTPAMPPKMRMRIESLLS
ncbi:hypothetical protein LPJ56_000771 [Coemansia sp. RSA 2599]|nr:hypothetical protein LPJ75_000258 [Coemansia sp. RSA 2598]KAJ1828949.1 hypothetical protein LPJ56_000771 [Coemansia sp. RSA 2599]